MLAFPINTAVSFPWTDVPVMTALGNFFSLFSLKKLAATFGFSFSPVGFYVCLVWILAIIGTAIWYASQRQLGCSVGL